MLEKWHSLPVLARWILFLPAALLLTLIGSALFSLPAAILASADSFLGRILMLLGSVITVSIFTWSSMNLPPSRNKFIGWSVFGLLLVHFCYSTLLLFDGKNIFGEPLPGPVGVFWGIQNMVWLVTCFVTVYFSREPRGTSETADI
jgi:hypothetical protein